ncbi:MAG: hypothetical protein ABR517_09525 [Thermoanaerobaculia bacterium]
MMINSSPRGVLTLAVTLLTGFAPAGSAQIFTEWSTPVNLTALNSSAADA